MFELIRTKMTAQEALDKVKSFKDEEWRLRYGADMLKVLMFRPENKDENI